jgi:hypothetical protein
MLGGLPGEINKPKKSKSESSTPASETTGDAIESQPDFKNRTLHVRKKYYDRLKMESIRQNKFIWQVLDEALAMYLKDK